MSGFYLWILQTVTALYLVFGLYVHIFIIPLIGNLPYDLVFVAVAVYHGLNGLWGIIDESFRGKGWKVREKFKTLISDFTHNRHAGHFIFIVHRLTGLFLILYLIQHVFTNSYVSFYLSIDNLAVVELLKNDFIDYTAVLSLCFHSVNGIRLIFIELTCLTWLQRRLAHVSLMLGVLLALEVFWNLRS